MTHLVHLSRRLFEPGDRLSRDEFLELWEQMPDLKFAELIDGVVYMPSPLSSKHSRYDGLMLTIPGVYASRTNVCEVLPNATWLMADSAPQPDAALRVLRDFGGRADERKGLASRAPKPLFEPGLAPDACRPRRGPCLERMSAVLERLHSSR